MKKLEQICNSSYPDPEPPCFLKRAGGGVVASLSPRENETFVMYIGRDFNDFGCLPGPESGRETD